MARAPSSSVEELAAGADRNCGRVNLTYLFSCENACWPYSWCMSKGTILPSVGLSLLQVDIFKVSAGSRTETARPR